MSSELEITHHIEGSAEEGANLKTAPAQNLHESDGEQEFNQTGIDKGSREKGGNLSHSHLSHSSDPDSEKISYIVVDEDKARHLGKDNTFSGETPTQEFHTPVEAVKAAYGARQEHAAELEGGDVHVHSVVAGEIVQSPTFRVVDEPDLLEHTWRNISDHPVPDEVKEFQRQFSQSHNMVGFGVAGQVHSFEGPHDVGILENNLPDEYDFVRNSSYERQQLKVFSSFEKALKAYENTDEVSYKLGGLLKDGRGVLNVGIHQIDSHGIPRQIGDDHFDKLINEKGFSSPETSKTSYVLDGVEDKGDALSKGYVNNDQSKQVSGDDQSLNVTTTRSYQISLSKTGQNKPFTTTDVTIAHGVNDEKTQAILKANVKQFAMSSKVELADVSAKVMRQKDVHIDYSKNISLGTGLEGSLGE